MQPTDCAVPRISLAPLARFLASDFDRIVRAMSKISSRVMLPVCLMFFSFLRSRGGSVQTVRNGIRYVESGKTHL